MISIRWEDPPSVFLVDNHKLEIKSTVVVDMTIDIDQDPKGSREIQKRANELARHTRLSETEALVYAARSGVGSGRWSHSIISEHIDGGESASQNHLARARKKATEAKATHKLLNKGKRGPSTGHTPRPLPEDPAESGLTDIELFGEVEVCDHWLDLGVETAWGGDMDIKQQKNDLLDEIANRGIEDEFMAFVND
jgi:hypothetical protein